LKLWLDTDPGVDDALALALIVGHPGLELVGVSTVFGNASLAQTTSNALGLLAMLDAGHVPVHAGASEPLVGLGQFAPHVHGGDGLGGVASELPSPTSPLQVAPADQALLAASARWPDLHLAAIGPLTNLARALRLDPHLPNRLASLTVMGGAFGHTLQRGQHPQRCPSRI
jgi:purine nucleosidase